MAALCKDDGLEVIKPVHGFWFGYRSIVGVKKSKCKECGK